MFYAAAAQKLSHTKFQSSDAEEICNLVKEAKRDFLLLNMSANGQNIGTQLFSVGARWACSRTQSTGFHAIHASTACMQEGRVAAYTDRSKYVLMCTRAQLTQILTARIEHRFSVGTDIR
jgi:hypothetical protein